MEVDTLTLALIQRLTDDLLKIGEDPDLGEPETRLALERVGPYGRINRQTPQTWDRAVEGLNCQGLENLTRGLTIAEHRHRWIGGSVAAVIWVFRVFSDRCPQRADALADWVLRNSTNPWEPFGSRHYGRRTLNDYRQDRIAREERKALRAARQCEVRQATVKQRTDSARRHHDWKIRREVARGLFISALARLSPRLLLERLLDPDLGFPIDAVPAEMVPLDVEVLEQLEASVRQKLLEKIDHRPGVWAELRGRLEALGTTRED